MNNMEDKGFLQTEMIEQKGDLRGLFVMPFETFLRYRMGANYYRLKDFAVSFLYVAFVRMLYLPPDLPTSGWKFHITDVILGVYIFLGLSHLVNHMRLRSRGGNSHSLFMGYSRLFIIGKALILLFNLVIKGLSYPFTRDPYQLSYAPAYYLTYVIIEPAVPFAIAAGLYVFQGVHFLPLFLVASGCLMIWNSIRKINLSSQIALDRQDAQIFSEGMEQKIDKMNQESMNRSAAKSEDLSGYLNFREAPSQPVKEIDFSKLNSPAVSDILKKVNAEEKDRTE